MGRAPSFPELQRLAARLGTVTVEHDVMGACYRVTCVPGLVIDGDLHEAVLVYEDASDRDGARRAVAEQLRYLLDFPPEPCTIPDCDWCLPCPQHPEDEDMGAHECAPDEPRCVYCGEALGGFFVSTLVGTLSSADRKELLWLAECGGAVKSVQSCVDTDCPRLESLGLVVFVKETRSGTTWFRLTPRGLLVLSALPVSQPSAK